MAATTSSNNSKINRFIDILKTEFPAYGFCIGKHDHWSPEYQKVTYNPDRPYRELQFCILHELAHAELNHKNYNSDIELLKLESEAWSLAAKLGKRYKVKITEEHIQRCLDSYRDWLHGRSACPSCSLRVLQTDAQHYECFNCHKTWAVTPDRFTRAYRKQKTL